ncbi:MAG: transposase [Hormoscilla sp. GM7CHS1pb]|nr:transposase [Hormoscilla sp. GM7CHS1pb]
MIRRFKGRSDSGATRGVSEITLWRISYFVGSAGNVSSATIQRYIANQR